MNKIIYDNMVAFNIMMTTMLTGSFFMSDWQFHDYLAGANDVIAAEPEEFVGERGVNTEVSDNNAPVNSVIDHEEFSKDNGFVEDNANAANYRSLLELTGVIEKNLERFGR